METKQGQFIYLPRAADGFQVRKTLDLRLLALFFGGSFTTNPFPSSFSFSFSFLSHFSHFIRLIGHFSVDAAAADLLGLS